MLKVFLLDGMPPLTQQFTVRTWNDFQKHWAGVHNFLVADECLPFDFEMPPLDRVISELRDDEQARITSGARTHGRRLQLVDTSEAFRALPIEQAMEGSFALAHFKLSRFDAPGKFLHGFLQGVLDPWRDALGQAGFTFDRCYPIIFISGKGCATNYHMDLSHVLAWQIYGQKRFCGVKDPDRWGPSEVRLNSSAPEFGRPSELTEEDALCYDMPPGSALWNALLTPHWVDAGDQVAMSVNISHGGLRYKGQLCPHEQELVEHQLANPDTATPSPTNTY